MDGLPGLIVAAPATASGKTVVTLALLRLLVRDGVAVASFKVGPDYIDPAFHAAAIGASCYNLDCRAMRPATMAAIARRISHAALVIGEGVMGLFDGAPDGTGSTADLSALTGWPVVLVVDAARQGASAAAVVHGFASFRADVTVAGVIFNRIAGPRHAAMIERAVEAVPVPVLGYLPRLDDLALPSRHLGLVQAAENTALEGFLDRAADALAENVDVERLRACARPADSAFGAPPEKAAVGILPLGQRIAVARDQAFGFAYAHMLEGWRAAGAELLPFSPLADEAPDGACDAVFLPGGYPELHGAQLAANRGFLDGVRASQGRGAAIYGECGGYMVLGEGLVDGDGARHQMAGLLPLETSFAERRLHLGYRDVALANDAPVGAAGAGFRGHEFHYATVTREQADLALFACRGGNGEDLGAAGMVQGRVAGSFIHLIDRA